MLCGENWLAEWVLVYLFKLTCMSFKVTLYCTCINYKIGWIILKETIVKEKKKKMVLIRFSPKHHEPLLFLFFVCLFVFLCLINHRSRDQHLEFRTSFHKTISSEFLIQGNFKHTHFHERKSSGTHQRSAFHENTFKINKTLQERGTFYTNPINLDINLVWKSSYRSY